LEITDGPSSDTVAVCEKCTATSSPQVVKSWPSTSDEQSLFVRQSVQCSLVTHIIPERFNDGALQTQDLEDVHVSTPAEFKYSSPGEYL
jgi:hypothetical protein